MKDIEEFKNAIRQISLTAPNLENAYDRIRVAQWIKKLTAIPDDNLEFCKVRNEYAQYLRIQVRNKLLHGIFKELPPEAYNIPPLAEYLGNHIAKRIPDLPQVGPIAPMMKHHSPDGSAYIAAKQIPGGVFCYLAVTANGIKIN